ncbi:MAG: hypothetical protein ABSG91_00630 [Syntrophobacteraceae bacterium]|jgi:hypothetical protein
MKEANTPNSIYLFDMLNGGKKLAYGKNPEDALEVLSLRLTPEEMEHIVRTKYRRIKSKDLISHVHELG